MTPSPGWTAADALVLATLVLTVVAWSWLTRDAWFFWDEWALAGRGRSLGDLVEPYNGHLSITYIALFRLHMALFGLDHHWVLHTVALVVLASVPLLLHLTTRRRLGPPVAGCAAVLVLWTHRPGMEAGMVNHSAALALGVVTAWALERGSRRADAVVAATLVLGFATAGGTAAVAAAAGVHTLLSRGPWRRWAAVLVPTALWYGWLQWKVGAHPVPASYRLDRGEILHLVLDGQVAALRGVGLGTTVGAVVVGAVLLAGAVRQVAVHGRRGATTLAAWLVADAAWWIGLAQNRGVLADPGYFRYRWVASVFLVLAVVPPVAATHRRPAPAPAAGTVGPDRRAAGWRAPAVPAAALAVLVAVVVGAGLGTTRDEARVLAESGRVARVDQTLALVSPSPLPADHSFGITLSMLTAGDVARLARLYGPGPPSGEEADRALLADGAVVVTAVAPAGRGPCAPLGDRPRNGIAVIRTDGPTTLLLRRFGARFVVGAQLPARSDVTVHLGVPSLGDGWRVRAVGACRVGVGS